jgi:hypothetical protein
MPFSKLHQFRLYYSFAYAFNLSLFPLLITDPDDSMDFIFYIFF